MDKKGFTLVELLATLVILAMVLSIGTYAITSIIQNSKDKNYELLISNIKDATELYYQECKYSNNSGISCMLDDNKYQTTLGDLVTYGYLKGNKQDENNNKKYTLVNPQDDVNISECKINVEFADGKVSVSAVDPSGSCPTEY